MEQKTGNFLGETRLAFWAMSYLRAVKCAIATFGETNSPARMRWGVLALVALTFCATCARATIVRFNTSYGNIDVRLYNAATPLSVANFLNYSNSGRFNSSIIHRSVPEFIIQGGGFYYPTPTSSLTAVPTDPPVLNEYGISNLRGTIAYAKIGADPPTPASINSATSGWFFNLDDNSSNLNNQNGGFTVFGRVLGSGMSVVDTIANLDIVNAGSPFNNLPVVDLDAVLDRGSVIKSDLVFINSVTVRNLPAGDYDFNGTVNAADYAVWKNTLGSTTNAAADGNGDGRVDAADYTIWRNTFGQTTSPGSGALDLVSWPLPEPSAAVLAAISSLCWFWASSRRRSSTRGG